MSNKIIILCSSPRAQGNTNTVAGWARDAAVAAGAQVEMIDIARLNYKSNGCTACMGCQKSDKYECVINDDAQPILKRIPEFDLVVLATPIYFFNANAQAKLFMDRMYSLVKFNMDTGEYTAANPTQRWALIATAGGDMETCLKPLEMTFQSLCTFCNSQLESLLIPLAPLDPEQMRQNADIKQKARAFGQTLAKL